MRLVVLLLLFLNVAFFAWQFQFAGQENSIEMRQPPSVGAPMLLWDEWKSQQEKLSNRSVEKQTIVLQKTSPPRLGLQPIAKACFTVGPFSIVSDVSLAASLFEGDEITTQQRAAASRRRAGFWVYIPPQGSLQAAREVLRYLQSNNVEDALIIAEGSKENSISVGVYANSDKAELRQKAISELGYIVEIEPLYRTQPQYWLDLELWKETIIPPRIWANMVRKFPSITAEKRNCQ